LRPSTADDPKLNSNSTGIPHISQHGQMAIVRSEEENLTGDERNLHPSSRNVRKKKTNPKAKRGGPLRIRALQKLELPGVNRMVEVQLQKRLDLAQSCENRYPGMCPGAKLSGDEANLTGEKQTQGEKKEREHSQCFLDIACDECGGRRAGEQTSWYKSYAIWAWGFWLHSKPMNLKTKNARWKGGKEDRFVLSAGFLAGSDGRERKKIRDRR